MGTAIEADPVLSAVCQHVQTGTPLDPALLRKIDAEAEAIRDEIKREHGLVNVAVELVHEARARQ